MTYEEFVAAHDEFANPEEFSRAAVEQALVDAALETPASTWGDLTSGGIRYLTGHLLACSPRGIKARMTSLTAEGRPPVTSTYLVHRQRLEMLIGAGPGVA